MGVGLSVEHQSATVARHLSLFLGGNNLNLVCSQAEKLKSVSGCRPNVVTVLTDTPGEDEKINPAQKSSVGADYFANRDGKDFQRKIARASLDLTRSCSALTSLSPDERAKRPL